MIFFSSKELAWFRQIKNENSSSSLERRSNKQYEYNNEKHAKKTLSPVPLNFLYLICTYLILPPSGLVAHFLLGMEIKEWVVNVSSRMSNKVDKVIGYFSYIINYIFYPIFRISIFYIFKIILIVNKVWTVNKQISVYNVNNKM